MNARELFTESEGGDRIAGASPDIYKRTGIWFCEKCRVVARTREQADQCCAPKLCETCGQEADQPYSTLCIRCQSANRDAKEAARFDKATKLTHWDGPVYCDGLGWEGYADTLEELLEDVDIEDFPEYVWTCATKPVVTLDLDDIIDNATQDAYEDFDPHDLNGRAELKAAIDAFNEANKIEVNKSNIVWEPDLTVALLVRDQMAKSIGSRPANLFGRKG